MRSEVIKCLDHDGLALVKGGLAVCLESFMGAIDEDAGLVDGDAVMLEDDFPGRGGEALDLFGRHVEYGVAEKVWVVGVLMLSRVNGGWLVGRRLIPAPHVMAPSTSPVLADRRGFRYRAGPLQRCERGSGTWWSWFIKTAAVR